MVETPLMRTSAQFCGGPEGAAAAGDLFAGNENVAVEIQRDACGICFAAGTKRDYCDGAELGSEAIEECGI